MKRIAIVAKVHASAAGQVVPELARWLADKGLEVVVDPNLISNRQVIELSSTSDRSILWSLAKACGRCAN